MASVEEQITQWREHLERRRAVTGADVDELEDHLRGHVTSLEAVGLAEEEALLVAVRRMGAQDELSREFAREHSERLWKQLVLADDDPGPGGRAPGRDLRVVAGLALAGALLIKAPELVGMGVGDDVDGPFYLLNVSLLVLPALMAYFAWGRRLGRRGVGVLVAALAAAAVVANVPPYDPEGSMVVLVALHLPMALWLVAGIAYAGGDWRGERARMDFIRFTGEWIVYLTLLAMGGGVLMVVTIGVFDAAGVSADDAVLVWLLPAGAAGAVVVGAWLVEAKQSVVENMAPVLTKVFTPLVTLVLLSFLGTLAWTRTLHVERDVLILFDVVLALTLGLLLYSCSARDPLARAGIFDRLQLVLVGAALLIDVLVLAAIWLRIGEFGFSPNKVAALGENLILLVNLAVAGWLQLGFVRGRRPFAAVERWQTSYVPVYLVWAVLVVTVFPLVFGLG